MGATPPLVPREQSLHMLNFSRRKPLFQALVGSKGHLGVRYRLGKLCVERYVCQEEPLLNKQEGLHFVFWTRFQARQEFTEIDRKWKKLWMPALFCIGEQYGFGRVHKDYVQDWKGNTRRAARQAMTSGIVLRRVSLDDLAKEYHASKHLDVLTRMAMISVVRAHVNSHPEDVHSLLAYKGQEVLGGAVFTDFPDIALSSYTLSFLNAAGKAQQAGYAYILWWYEHLLKHSLAWADFGFIWQRGDPKGWKGSSDFKRRFGLEMRQKKTYWQVVRS